VELIYARWLDWGTRLALGVLIAGFLAYALGLLEPWLPLAQLPAVWGLPVEQYLAAIGAPRGWGWLALVHRGDFANFAGIALLALVTVACYLRLLAALLAAGERRYALLVFAQVVVLVAAASGLFSSAG
jgi:hypothetical protein